MKNKNIFTIGDKIIRNDFNKDKVRVIESFWIKNDILYVKCNDGNNLLLSEIKHSKEPLFITHDNIEIYDKLQRIYLVNPVNCAMCPITAGVWDKTRLIFSSEKAALNYIKINKPVLSYNDVREILVKSMTVNWYRKYYKNKLTELVKSKL